MQVKRTGETGGRHEDIVAVRNEGPLQTENFQTAKQGDTVGLSWVENDPRKHISKQGRSLRWYQGTGMGKDTIHRKHSGRIL